MTNPLTHAFFLGRATAEALSHEFENALANVFSEVGKFDAEQRERLRQFTTQVIERANQEEAIASQGRAANSTSSTATARPPASKGVDLQTTIDELRAEIARLRSELQNYRNR
jgi:molecular chaperone GrpE (heat shock protein)